MEKGGLTQEEALTQVEYLLTCGVRAQLPSVDLELTPSLVLPACRYGGAQWGKCRVGARQEQICWCVHISALSLHLSTCEI